MSEFTYQDNVRRGVVGPRSSNCLVASYDRISDRTGISPQTYCDYEDVRVAYVEACGDGSNYVPPEIVERYNAIKTVFRRELGVPTNRNVVEARANTIDELHDRLGKLSIGGFRIAVYLNVGGLHAIGVMPVDDEHYLVRSTWSPFSDKDPTHVSNIFGYLDLAPRLHAKQHSSRKTYVNANIVALPPEIK